MDSLDFLCIDIRERKEGKKRYKNTDLLCVPLIYASIGGFLYVFSQRIEPTTLMYWDDAPTELPGQDLAFCVYFILFCFVFVLFVCLFFVFDTK